MRPPMAPGGLTSQASKPTFKRFNENDYGKEPGSGMIPSQSNRLLGNRQAFLN